MLAKSEQLAGSLRSLGRLLVAYSGGVDSAFLAWAAHRELGDEMLAVLADSPSLARSQMQDAVAFAEEQRIPLVVISTSEMENPEYRQNDASRSLLRDGSQVYPHLQDTWIFLRLARP